MMTLIHAIGVCLLWIVAACAAFVIIEVAWAILVGVCCSIGAACTSLHAQHLLRKQYKENMKKSDK